MSKFELFFFFWFRVNILMCAYALLIFSTDFFAVNLILGVQGGSALMNEKVK